VTTTTQAYMLETVKKFGSVSALRVASLACLLVYNSLWIPCCGW